MNEYYTLLYVAVGVAAYLSIKKFSDLSLLNKKVGIDYSKQKTAKVYLKKKDLIEALKRCERVTIAGCNLPVDAEKLEEEVCRTSYPPKSGWQIRNAISMIFAVDDKFTVFNGSIARRGDARVSFVSRKIHEDAMLTGLNELNTIKIMQRYDFDTNYVAILDAVRRTKKRFKLYLLNRHEEKRFSCFINAFGVNNGAIMFLYACGCVVE